MPKEITYEEFSNKVTELANDLMMEWEYEQPGIAICACIEAACNISIKHDRAQMLTAKLRQVADYVDRELSQ